MHLVALFAETLETLWRLAAGGADPDARARGDVTPMHAVIASKPRLDFIAALIEVGAHLEARESNDGLTALLLAAAITDAEVLGLLLDAGANPSSRAKSGQTAWDLAIQNRLLAEHPIPDRLRTLRS